ncbi:hypothetical protein [Alloactinosynnema sp. L-07]|nr:hypothetical protein [Alloactinosynnema sp. L-07]
MAHLARRPARRRGPRDVNERRSRSDVTLGQPASAVITAITAAGFGIVWFALPARQPRD